MTAKYKKGPNDDSWKRTIVEMAIQKKMDPGYEPPDHEEELENDGIAEIIEDADDNWVYENDDEDSFTETQMSYSSDDSEVYEAAESEEEPRPKRRLIFSGDESEEGSDENGESE